MTTAEFLRLRQKENWRNKHALTVTGYYVAGVGIGIYQDKVRYGRRYRFGRVVENPQGERANHPHHADWDMNGVALGHKFGNLDMATVNTAIYAQERPQAILSQRICKGSGMGFELNREGL